LRKEKKYDEPTNKSFEHYIFHGICSDMLESFLKKVHLRCCYASADIWGEPSTDSQTAAYGAREHFISCSRCRQLINSHWM